MKKFNKKFKYDDYMDEEVVNLCDVMNSLPGIETTESCSGHGKFRVNIWFKVKENSDGLNFLTRCTDNRYWQYGHLWNINLSISDRMPNPTTYRLYSTDIGEEAYTQIESLIENFNHHLNHKNFMKFFELNPSDYFYSKIEIRKLKLDKLKLKI